MDLRKDAVIFKIEVGLNRSVHVEPDGSSGSVVTAVLTGSIQNGSWERVEPENCLFNGTSGSIFKTLDFSLRSLYNV